MSSANMVAFLPKPQYVQCSFVSSRDHITENEMHTYFEIAGHSLFQ